MQGFKRRKEPHNLSPFNVVLPHSLERVFICEYPDPLPRDEKLEGFIVLVKRFAHSGISVAGALLNGLDPKSGRRSYVRKTGAYRYVQYRYEEAQPALVSRWRQILVRLGLGR